MKIFCGTVKKLGGLTYLPAPELNEPEGIFRRIIEIQSDDFEESEKDEIVATLWDYQALLDIQVGDKVLVTLQFRVFQRTDGTEYLGADVSAIERINDFKEKVRW